MRRIVFLLVAVATAVGFVASIAALSGYVDEEDQGVGVVGLN